MRITYLVSILLNKWCFHVFFLLKTPRSGSPGYSGGHYSEGGPSADNKMALTDFGSFRPVVRDINRKVYSKCIAYFMKY